MQISLSLSPIIAWFEKKKKILWIKEKRLENHKKVDGVLDGMVAIAYNNVEIGI